MSTKTPKETPGHDEDQDLDQVRRGAAGQYIRYCYRPRVENVRPLIEVVCTLDALPSGTI